MLAGFAQANTTEVNLADANFPPTRWLSGASRVGFLAAEAMWIDSTVPLPIAFSPCRTGNARPYTERLVALAHDGDGLLESIDCDIGFVFGRDQRWRNANRARAATQEQNAAFEGQFDDMVALGGGVLLCLLVLDDLNADHQPAAANIAHQLVFVWPGGDSLQYVIADFGRIPHQVFALDHIECSQCGRNADRVAAKGRSVRTGNPVHDLGFADGHAEGHAGSDPFSYAHNVRLHSGVLDRPPPSGATGATLHFIRHQQNAVAIADTAQLLHEDIGGDHVAALPLDRLDEDCRHFLGRERGPEELVLDEAGTAKRKSFGILRATFATTVNVWVANVRDTRQQRSEAALLLRL